MREDGFSTKLRHDWLDLFFRTARKNDVTEALTKLEMQWNATKSKLLRWRLHPIEARRKGYEKLCQGVVEI